MQAKYRQFTRTTTKYSLKNKKNEILSIEWTISYIYIEHFEVYANMQSTISNYMHSSDAYTQRPNYTISIKISPNHLPSTYLKINFRTSDRKKILRYNSMTFYSNVASSTKNKKNYIKINTIFLRLIQFSIYFATICIIEHWYRTWIFNCSWMDFLTQFP